MRRFVDYTQTMAGKKLLEHAVAPFDLTRPGALLADDRLDKYVCNAAGWRLCYATQRIDTLVLSLLQDMADELQLVEQFKAMRRGAVCNQIVGFPSENRQVLHTAGRDLFTEPAEPIATGKAKAELEKLRIFLDELDRGVICNAAGVPFDTFIQVGIGGSDLGPRAVLEALRAYGRRDRQVHCIANVDPDDAARVLGQVNLATTLVNIVSKSGTTLETLTNEQLVSIALKQQGLDPAKHCIAVTGEGSPMDDPSRYLRSFYMQDYIGGRYSATSMVGLVMLGFCLGYDQVLDFLRGAAAMDAVAEEDDLENNLPLLLALIGVWNHSFLGYPSVAVLPYSQALHRFPAHLQQCDMESNGKSVNRYGEVVDTQTGPVIWGEPGTNGQHAFYQLLHQGTEIVPAEFIGFLESQYRLDTVVEETSSQQKLLANLYAQVIALATGKKADNPNRNFPGNRPASLLMARRLTPEAMGALLSAYEAKIAFQGFAWNINSFDQEGVQLGKVLASGILRLMRGDSEGGDEVTKGFCKIVSTGW